MLGFAVAKNSELRKMASERLFLVFVQLVLKASMFSQVICACNDPNPPENMVVDRLHSGKSAADRFSIGESAYFKCKEGFVMKGVWWTLEKKCKGNDTWVWNNVHRSRAYCIKRSEICTNNTFTCRNGHVITCSKRCDCNPDCSDGSDEGYRGHCGPHIMVNITGKKYGTLKSPGYPRGYPGQLSCTYKIFTNDKGAGVSLSFDTFDLQPSRSSKDRFTQLPTEVCDDYIKLSNNEYSSMYKVQCSGIFNTGSCSAWCGGTSPPESRSIKNFILLEFHTSASTRKHKGFSASWENDGFIPPNWREGSEKPTDVFRFAHTRRIDTDQNPMRNGDNGHSGDGDDHNFDDDGNPSHGHRNANHESHPFGVLASIGVAVVVSVVVIVIAAAFVYWRRRQFNTVHVRLHNIM